MMSVKAAVDNLRVLLKKTDVLRCARYLVTELSEIKKPKRFS